MSVETFYFDNHNMLDFATIVSYQKHDTDSNGNSKIEITLTNGANIVAFSHGETQRLHAALIRFHAAMRLAYSQENG